MNTNNNAPLTVIRIRNKIIDAIIKVEGGYVDDPSDSGGETKYGITIRTARVYGYLDLMIDLPLQVAEDIYRVNYWEKLRLDDIAATNDKLAAELMDTGVNQGTRAAGKYLQRALNILNNRGTYYADVVVDGAIGGKTIVAFNSYIKRRGAMGARVLLQVLDSLQAAFYIALAERREKDEKFIYGWFLHRIR